MRRFYIILFWLFFTGFTSPQTIIIIDDSIPAIEEKLLAIENFSKARGAQLYIFNIKKTYAIPITFSYRILINQIVRMINEAVILSQEKTNIVFSGDDSRVVSIEIINRLVELNSYYDVNKVFSIYSIDSRHRSISTEIDERLESESVHEDIDEHILRSTDEEVVRQLSDLRGKISKLEISSEERDGRNICVITKKKVSIGSGFVMAIVAAIALILTAVIV